MLLDNKYKTGIETIDQQHSRWLTLISDLLDALLTDTVESELNTIFQSTRDYIQLHLKYEEELMRINNFPDFERHKKLHAAMTRYFNKMEKRITKLNASGSQDKARDDLIRVGETMLNWLYKHIEIEDKKFIPYCKRIPPEPALGAQSR